MTDKLMDQDEIRWWQISRDARDPEPELMRAVYHERTKWLEHPWYGIWGAKRRGADFVAQWSIESWDPMLKLWAAVGRSDSGVKRVGAFDHPVWVFATWEEARDAAAEIMEGRQRQAADRLREDDAHLAKLQLASKPEVPA